MRRFAGQINIEQHITLLVVGLPLLITLILLLLGVGIPRNQGTIVQINEIYAHPEQPVEQYWLELYNNTDELIDLSGWSVQTFSGTQTLSSAVLQGRTRLGPDAYLLVPANPAAFASATPVLAAGAAMPDQPLVWHAARSRIELLSPEGHQVDSIAWPTRSTPPAAPSPRTPVLVRRSLGLDSNSDTDWRGAPTPSPGSRALPTLHPATRVLLLEVTNYIALIGGFLLWAAFVVIGMIARRFERLTGQRTFWQAMVIAPIGIVIYNLIQTRAFFARGSMTDCRTPGQGWTFHFAGCEQLWSFVPLFLAAVVMIYVVMLFYRAARRILEV